LYILYPKSAYTHAHAHAHAHAHRLTIFFPLPTQVRFFYFRYDGAAETIIQDQRADAGTQHTTTTTTMASI